MYVQWTLQLCVHHSVGRDKYVEETYFDGLSRDGEGEVELFVESDGLFGDHCALSKRDLPEKGGGGGILLHVQDPLDD